MRRLCTVFVGHVAKGDAIVEMVLAATEGGDGEAIAHAIVSTRTGIPGRGRRHVTREHGIVGGEKGGRRARQRVNSGCFAAVRIPHSPRDDPNLDKFAIVRHYDGTPAVSRAGV